MSDRIVTVKWHGLHRDRIRVTATRGAVTTEGTFTVAEAREVQAGLDRLLGDPKRQRGYIQILLDATDEDLRDALYFIGPDKRERLRKALVRGPVKDRTERTGQ